MPRRVPAAAAVEDILEVDGNRYIVVARDPEAPQLLHLFDPKTGDRWPLDPATDEPLPFDIAKANRDGRAWRYVRDLDDVAQMIELVLESELILDPVARDTAEARRVIVENIRAHRKVLLTDERERRDGLRAAARAGVALDAADEQAGEPLRTRLDAYCTDMHGLGVATYYRWEQALTLAGGSVVGLLHEREAPGPGSRSRSANAGSRLTDEQSALVTWAYETHYKKKPNKEKSLTFAHAALVHRAEALEQAPVGLGTLWAIFIGVDAGQRRPNGELPRHRSTNKAEEAEAARAYYETIWNGANLPGEYVFEDSHLLDLRGVDARFRLPMSRLWIHLLFDAYSGCVPGFYPSVRGPATQTLQMGLMHAVFPRDFQAEFGVAAAHPHMVTQHLIVDNAWGYHSHSLRAVCNDIGRYGVNPITLVFRTPYDARRGALIERFFGKFETELIHHLSGMTHSNPQARGDYDSDGHAVLLFEDIIEALVRYLDIYHNTPQRRLLGRTPLERYREGAARMGRMPEPNDSRARLLFRVLHPQARVVDRQGFKLWGLRFNAPCLDPYRSNARTRDRDRIHVRYDEDDIRNVSAYANGAYLGEVPCLNLPMRAGGFKATALRHWDSVKALGSREVPDGKGGTRRIAVPLSASKRAELFADIDRRTEQRAAESARARLELERQRLQARQGAKPVATSAPAPPGADTLVPPQGRPVAPAPPLAPPPPPAVPVPSLAAPLRPGVQQAGAGGRRSGT